MKSIVVFRDNNRILRVTAIPPRRTRDQPFGCDQSKCQRRDDDRRDLLRRSLPFVRGKNNATAAKSPQIIATPVKRAMAAG